MKPDPEHTERMDILTHEECLALITTVPIGRIVFTEHALPAIRPVCFAFDGHNIYIQTSRDSQLATATHNTIVAFEVDDYDTHNKTGWSITILGRAQHLCDPDEIAASGLQPTWAPGRRDHHIRIHAELLTGRRIPTTEQ